MAALPNDLARNTTAVRDRVLKGMDRLPPLSPVVGKLLGKLTFSSVGFAELAQFIERDVLLCAHILRTANSASFARSRTINSVWQAMSLLGIDRLRRIALSFTMAALFSKAKTPAAWSRQRFNLHSAATGLMAEAIADSLPIGNRDGAFVGGMLHDMGKLLMAVTSPDEYEALVALALASGSPMVECERQSLGFDHAEISGVALDRWGLPEIISKAVYCHHTPEKEGAPWLAAVIHRADRFVNHLGITVLAPPEMEGESPPLDIPGYEYDTNVVLRRFEAEWKDLSAFFQ